jgi:hypothetical protein
MARKKDRPRRQPWWQRRKVRRQLMVLAALVWALALFGLAAVYFGGRGNHHETAQNVSGPAPAFSLPTTAGDEFVSADHLGQHALLLYFNEGVG